MDWREVGATAHRLRRSGQTLPLTDLAIAVAAVLQARLLLEESLH